MFYFSPDRATHHGHIKEKRPNSNPQADSIQAKVLDQVTLFLHIFLDFLTPKLVYIWTKRIKFAFDNGHKMTSKRHVVAFIVSFKIILMRFLYFFFGRICLPAKKSLSWSHDFKSKKHPSLFQYLFFTCKFTPLAFWWLWNFCSCELTCFFLFVFFKMSSGISSMTA